MFCSNCHQYVKDEKTFKTCKDCRAYSLGSRKIAQAQKRILKENPKLLREAGNKYG